MMNNVYIVVTRTDTVFEDSFREVSAIFKSHADALRYLQKKYEEYSKEAERHNKKYECDEWQCYFTNGVLKYYADMEDTTSKIVSVKFGDEIDIWKLT
jgi:hypothetical protein